MDSGDRGKLGNVRLHVELVPILEQEIVTILPLQMEEIIVSDQVPNQRHVQSQTAQVLVI